MPSELSVHAVQQGPMAFAINGGGHDVTVDYPLPGTYGDLKGMTPLRLLLASLAGCSGSSVAALLRRDEQPLQRVDVTTRGQRRALRSSEAQICPVWAMVKTGTPVSSSFTVVDG